MKCRDSTKSLTILSNSSATCALAQPKKQATVILEYCRDNALWTSPYHCHELSIKQAESLQLVYVLFGCISTLPLRVISPQTWWPLHARTVPNWSGALQWRPLIRIPGVVITRSGLLFVVHQQAKEAIRILTGPSPSWSGLVNLSCMDHWSQRLHRFSR